MTIRRCKDCQTTDESKFGSKKDQCRSCYATYNRVNKEKISKREAAGMIIGQRLTPTKYIEGVEENRVEILIR